MPMPEMPPLTGKQLGIMRGAKPGYAGRPIMEWEDPKTGARGFSTHRSWTVPYNGQWYEIPGMFGGQPMDEWQARAHMIRHNMVDPETGEAMLPYATPEAADEAGKARHDQVEQDAISVLKETDWRPRSGSLLDPARQEQDLTAPGVPALARKIVPPGAGVPQLPGSWWGD